MVNSLLNFTLSFLIIWMNFFIFCIWAHTDSSSLCLHAIRDLTTAKRSYLDFLVTFLQLFGLFHTPNPRMYRLVVLVFANIRDLTTTKFSYLDFLANISSSFWFISYAQSSNVFWSSVDIFSIIIQDSLFKSSQWLLYKVISSGIAVVKDTYICNQNISLITNWKITQNQLQVCLCVVWLPSW